jgi:hypothetical protein
LAGTYSRTSELNEVARPFCRSQLGSSLVVSCTSFPISRFEASSEPTMSCRVPCRPSPSVKAEMAGGLLQPRPRPRPRPRPQVGRAKPELFKSNSNNQSATTALELIHTKATTVEAWMSAGRRDRTLAVNYATFSSAIRDFVSISSSKESTQLC